MTNTMKCGFCDGVLEFGKPIMWHEGKYYHESCYINTSIGNHFIVGETIEYIPEGFEKSFTFHSYFKRDSWNVYFMKLADLVSTRSTCDRKHCGAVITLNNKIVSTGYNGSPPGEPHCDDVGHFMVNNSCKRTSHAEVNAINQAKERFPNLEGCKIYSNTFPCFGCFGEIVKSGIREIFYKDEYRNDELIEKISKLLDIKIEKVSLDS